MQLTEKQKSEGWRIVKFGDVAQNIIERYQPLEGDESIFIGLEHIESKNLRIASWGSKTVLKSQTIRFKKGDILFPKRNTYLKRIAIAPIDGIGSGDLIVVRPTKNNYMLDGLLKFIMQSNSFFEHVIANSSGSLSKRTKFKSLIDFQFPLPPRTRQERIVKLLQRVENVRKYNNNSQANFTQAKRIITQNILKSDYRKVLLRNIAEVITSSVNKKIYYRPISCSVMQLHGCLFKQ